jgi:tetratricopeptide (TPR) repeat protein
MMGRKAHLATFATVQLGVVGGSLLLLSLPARAQAAPRRRDQGPLYTHVDTGQQAAATARALAAKGNCAAALEAFDQALHASIDLAVRRDRGLCHEQLGNAFPAMDDYRAYLVAQPDAPDSNDIRERLERLEAQTGVGGPSPDGPAPQKSAEAIPDEPADVSGPLTSDDGKGKKRNAGKTYEQEEVAYHRYDDAVSSPLRLGKGGIFGIYGDGRVASGIGGYEVGASIRWSVAAASTLYGQIGYVSYQSNQGLSALEGAGAPISAGGVGLALGYEFRIRLDQYMTNAILVGGLVEYQHVTDSVLGPGNLFIPQGRAGYRHVFGHGVGLEFTADVGRVIAVGPEVIADGMDYGGSMAVVIAF